RVSPKRLAHVLSHEVEVRALALSCLLETLSRKVEPGDIESFRSQIPGVPACSAAKVESRRGSDQLMTFNQPVDELGSFLVAAVRVEPVIVFGIEPGGEPFFLGLEALGRWNRVHVHSPKRSLSFRESKVTRGNATLIDLDQEMRAAGLVRPRPALV